MRFVAGAAVVPPVQTLTAMQPTGAIHPHHSITSSAVASSDGGTVSPSILAVWALMTSSNFVDCSTGRSAGLAPLRI